MKNILLFICAACAVAVAQAAEPQKRLLTMEDVVLNRQLVPQNCRVQWSARADRYVVTRDTLRVEYSLLGADSVVLDAAAATAPKAHAKIVGQNIVWVAADGTERAVTSETDPNIVCGQSVSRNEFGINGGLFPSPDGRLLAFYRKDESRVGTFPLLDITTRTGSLREIKYPMNGMPSERVQIGVWSVDSGTTVYLQADDFDEERYMTCLTWSPDSRAIYVQVLARSQQQMRLNSYDVADGHKIATLLEEQNDRFVEPQYPLYFLDNNRFIYSTDNRDGYKSLYMYDLRTASLRRLTCVAADVEYVAHDAKNVYYYSSEVSPAQRHLFRTDLRSLRTVRLTAAEGWHNCTLSDDGRYFIDNYSSFSVPRVVRIASAKDGATVRTLLTAADPTADYDYTEIRTGTIKSADGRFDNNYRLVMPRDFDPAKKYPTILYVYGGPHMQLVNDSFQARLSRWEMYMAQRGYVVFIMDNRGTPYHGAEYEKAIHSRCGEAEMADQMKGMEWLMQNQWVDRDRIGVYGWSYGGFMTISLITTYPDVFKVAVAGGPVIDWKWYEVMYGERYMQTEATNPDGFAAVSLLSKAKQLRGKLLICQGAIDNTVVWQHSLSFIRECIKANIPVDYFPYPCAEHNVRGKDRVHLLNKISAYFDDYL